MLTIDVNVYIIVILALTHLQSALTQVITIVGNYHMPHPRTHLAELQMCGELQ